ncbi:uncharacterized protein [Epargyreus clarus]|uniref:uncharacterized protein n=1 Tax=Epargyreus clarus TaxID=520877 RepID=UPI003C2ADB5F
MSKRLVIIISVIFAVAVATGVAVLTWWLVSGRHSFSTIRLEGDGLGDVEFTAAYTRIRNTGDIFWWFYPTTATNKTTQPVILWLDGVTGLPPSLFANFMMFGPYDVNLNRRSNSWINSYNLLFVDSPLGTGFSTAHDGRIPNDLNGNAEHLHMVLQSFYSLHSDYSDTPLYICGQGDGGQLAIALASIVSGSNQVPSNLKGVIIGNGIISPAVALTKLGFYLEELAYIDANGRDAIERLSYDVNELVNERKYEDAFDDFILLGDFVNERAGAVAVNLRHIIDKLIRGSARDFFGHSTYLRDAFSSTNEAYKFMEAIIAPALGISSDVTYDDGRDDALKAFRSFLMNPATVTLERVLRDTEIPVTFYNGNLDAVSNTPGQLEWINNLTWPGQQQFLSARRSTLIVNSLVEGYFRETPRLTFYWMNAAGQAVPIESPVAMRRILDRITSN